YIFFFKAEDGIRDFHVTGVQTCALPISHFADTSVVARIENKVAALVTGYVPPKQPDTLFVWQVAVAKIAQRRGLAKTMIREILRSEERRVGKERDTYG